MLIPGLKGTLYKYQSEGVRFLNEKNGRALIADEMGLGKTVQALAWTQLHPEKRPVLVICPSSLKINWAREAKKWVRGLKIQILEGTRPYQIEGDFIIINYDILSKWLKPLMMLGINTIVADETHYVKHNGTQRTTAFKRLCRSGIPHLIALTGTPIENRPIEIFNIIYELNPSVFKNRLQFALDYCEAKKGRFGWDFTGAGNTRELNRILKNTVMIRRKKADVLKELPSKQIVVVPIEIDNKRDYFRAEDQFIRYVKEKLSKTSDDEIQKELKHFAKNQGIEVGEELSESEMQMLKQMKLGSISRAPILTQIEVLKQLAVKGKMKQIISWIEDFLESDEKLVVFAIHRKVVSELMEKFPDAVKVDGSVTSVQRQKAVDRFQNDKKVKLFIGNIKAAGVGITLTAASHAAIIQFPWSPGELVQAGDRIHRITQTKQVTIYNLVGQDTIEEKIISVLRKKEKIIGEVLDGHFREDTSVLSDLVDMYKHLKI